MKENSAEYWNPAEGSCFSANCWANTRKVPKARDKAQTAQGSHQHRDEKLRSQAQAELSKSFVSPGYKKL